MKKRIIRELLIILGLISLENCFAQLPATITSPGGFSSGVTNNQFWSRAGNNNINGSNNIFGTLWNSPIYTRTNGLNRMKLNGTFTYSINGFSQARNGYLLLGPDGTFGTGGTIYGNRGAYSLLHLNGAGTGLQEGGYRSWMQTGVTFTSNDDLAYIGHRRMGANDITDMVLAWSDNSQTSGVGPDNLIFNFTAGNGLGSDDLAGDNTNGREIMRLTPTGNVGVGPRFSNANQPASLFHINNYDNAISFLQITNQLGTGQTVNDGLHIGYSITNASWKVADINQKENDLLWLRSNDVPRITVSHTGALANGNNSNPGGLATDLTRVGIGGMLVPLSMLHIGFDMGSAVTTTTGWRSWMDIGTLSSTAFDLMYVGLKEETGSLLTGDRMDAIINWGDNDAPGAFNNGPDNLRFIFTGLQGATGPSGTANGLEVARMEPTEATTMTGNYGMMAIGDFSPGSTNATTPGLNVDAKLDVDGDLRIRTVNQDDLLEQVLVIDPNDLNRVKFRYLPATPAIIGAFNGTSIYSNGEVGLGQWLGSATFPSELVKNTEVPLNVQKLFFSDNTPYIEYGQGAVGIGVPTTLVAMPGKLAVLEQIDGTVLENTTAIYGLNRDVAAGGEFISGIQGRSDRASNILNFGGLFKGTHALKSYGIYVTADSSSGQSCAGYFQARSNDNSSTLGITSEASGSSTQNLGGTFFASSPSLAANVAVYAETPGPTSINPSPYPTDLAGDFIGNVYIDGTLGVAGVLGYSDINLKENINPISNALDSIKLLKPKNYHFKDQNMAHINFDSRRHFGFIAQDVEGVFPNLVSNEYSGPKLDTAGIVMLPSVPVKALDYQSIIALAVKAIQELDQKVTTQDSLITALNNQLQSCCSNNERNAPGQFTPNETTSFEMDVHLNNGNKVYLGQNVPNPFIEHTVINFSVPTDARQVEMQFFDQEGKEIQKINITQRGAGLLNVYGENLSAGMYTYVLVIDGKVVSSKRMVKTN